MHNTKKSEIPIFRGYQSTEQPNIVQRRQESFVWVENQANKRADGTMEHAEHNQSQGRSFVF